METTLPVILLKHVLASFAIQIDRRDFLRRTNVIKSCFLSCTTLQLSESRQSDEIRRIKIWQYPFQDAGVVKSQDRPLAQPTHLSNPDPSFSSLKPQNGSTIPSVLSSPLPYNILATVAFFSLSPSAHLFNCHIFASILSLNLSLGL